MGYEGFGCIRTHKFRLSVREDLRSEAHRIRMWGALRLRSIFFGCFPNARRLVPQSIIRTKGQIQTKLDTLAFRTYLALIVTFPNMPLSRDRMGNGTLLERGRSKIRCLHKPSASQVTIEPLTKDAVMIGKT